MRCKMWLDSINKNCYWNIDLKLMRQNDFHFWYSHFVLITLHLFSIRASVSFRLTATQKRTTVFVNLVFMYLRTHCHYRKKKTRAALRFQACKVSAPASKACTLSIEHKSRSIFIRACFAAVQLEAGLWNRGCSINISTFYKNRQEKYFKSNQTHYISFFFLFLHQTIF